METALQPLYEIMRLNTRLFNNCLVGVDDDMARTRLNGKSNNIAFIASHVVDARYFLAGYLGVEVSNPFKELLEGLRSIEEFTEFPLVRQVREAWRDVSRRLEGRFVSLTAAEIAASSPQAFPLEDGTVLGGVAFLLQHESYHIGQIGFLRRCFALDPMSYQTTGESP